MFKDPAEADLHPAGGVADPDSLALVAKAWGAKKSGVIRCDHLPGRGLLLHGEPRDDDSLKFLVQVLYVGGARFVDGDAFAQRPKPRLAAHLWAAASGLAARSPMGEAQLSDILVDGPAIQSVGLFPLEPDTRKLLAVRHDPREDLGTLLDHSGLSLKAVASDLGTLLALGALRLRSSAGGGARPRRASWSLKKGRPPTPPPPRRPPPRASKVSKLERARTRATPSRQKIEQLRTRLRRELGVVRDADDWTVVGANARMPREAIERACERMTGRYAKLMDDDRLPGDVRDLAQEIHARVLLAVGRISEGRAARGPTITGDPLEEGKRMIGEGRFELATKCFAKARQDTGSPIAQAWLGWSIYADPSRPEGDRRRKGRDLIEMALNSADFLPDPIYLMARVEYLEGDLVRSWNWLEKLMKIAPDHVDGRALLLDVRGQINKER